MVKLLKLVMLVALFTPFIGSMTAHAESAYPEITATETTPDHFSFAGIFPITAYQHLANNKVQHVNPVAYVYCNGVLSAYVGPWDRGAKIDAYNVDVTAEEPAGGYVLPAGQSCTASAYYWTTIKGSPTPTFIASTTFNTTA